MPIATTPHGNQILRFVPGNQPVVPPDDPDVPLIWVIVVIRHEGKVLMHYNPQRHQWELPGGGIEAGEHPDEAARREVMEETSQAVQQLQCKGVFKWWIKAEDRTEYAGLYTGTIDEILPFIPNEETNQILLWNTADTLDGAIGVVSTTMIELTRK